MLFRSFLEFLYFLQKIAGPFLCLFAPFVPALARRLAFEQLNRSDCSALSFAQQAVRADACFEVSSEGEFEQVRPLVNALLDKGRKVEIIYCSASLEKSIRNYKQMANVRTLRLPLLTSYLGEFNLREWISAPELYLCRYDFFPELLLAGLSLEKKRFVLVWGSLKNKDFLFSTQFSLNKWFLKNVYMSFDHIITPIASDLQKFQQLGVTSSKLSQGEFRLMQIHSRQQAAGHIIDSQLLQILESYPAHQRFIVGSAWPVEMDIFDNRDLRDMLAAKKAVFVVAPHDLGQSNVHTIIELLKKKTNLDVTVIDGNNYLPQEQTSSLIVLNQKGILCELYRYFGHAYVGGGHGRSVHSLLEPFVAQCMIYCGPKVHRSTEYDLIREIDPNLVTILQGPQDFFASLKDVQAVDESVINQLCSKTEKNIVRIVEGRSNDI